MENELTQKAGEVHAVTYIAQTTAVMIYVYARTPEDLFHCFNRISNLKYSRFAQEPPMVARDNSLFESVNSNVFVQEDENFVYLLAGKQSQVTTDSAMDYENHQQNQHSIIRQSPH